VEWVEVTAKTIEEAKDEALDQLGVDESEAEFEVLEEPKAGLFGRLRSEARVRARVAPTAVRPKLERGARRRGRKDRADEAGPSTAGGAECRWAHSVASSLERSNGGAPVSMWCRTHPSAYVSARPSMRSSRICSGAT